MIHAAEVRDFPYIYSVRMAGGSRSGQRVLRATGLDQ